MSIETRITRRRMLRITMGGASGAVAATPLSRREGSACLAADPVAADPKVQGPFLILSTPFKESGEVDFDVLANQARFMDWCGCPGMIWPQAGDAVDLLTTEEKLQGMDVLSATSRGFRSALCLGVNGKDTAEMLMYAKHVEKLAPTAIISRPPDSGETQDDTRQYWHAVVRPLAFNGRKRQQCRVVTSRHVVSRWSSCSWSSRSLAS